MMIKILLWAIAAAAALILLVLAVSALLVNPRKEYTQNGPYYRTLLDISTMAAMKLLRIHVTVKGKEKLPRNTRFLLVSNHRSSFDPIVTWYALRQQKIAFVSKPENFKIPIFGRIIRKCCFLPIDRQDARKAMGTIHSAANLLASGEVSVGIYPEGTRGGSDTLLPFHNGVFKIAKKANAPIVVMSVAGTDQIWKNWYRRPSQVTLNVLGVIPAHEVAQMKTTEIGEIVKERITDDLIKNTLILG